MTENIDGMTISLLHAMGWTTADDTAPAWALSLSTRPVKQLMRRLNLTERQQKPDQVIGSERPTPQAATFARAAPRALT